MAVRQMGVGNDQNERINEEYNQKIMTVDEFS